MSGNILEPNTAVNETISMFPWRLNSSRDVWGGAGGRGLDKYTIYINSEKIKQDNGRADYQN